ncbi:MAG: hypothetical protein VX075_13605, partial [Pseudomonadota bacterium]|nr:hypothetical protein [Pseudomonadota bacterium]
WWRFRLRWPFLAYEIGPQSLGRMRRPPHRCAPSRWALLSLAPLVLSLPTTGPVLIAALQSQDMYLAGSFLMFLASLTVIGVLVSDILLAWLDPRIRLAGGAAK